MELVKFCIRLITPRASAAFPACFPPSFFHLCRNIFVPPQRAAGWQMALWKGTDATLGCRFGLFLPQKWVSGAVTAPWQRREAEKRRKKKLNKTGRSEIKATSREEGKRSEPGCRCGWVRSLAGPARPARKDPAKATLETLPAALPEYFGGSRAGGSPGSHGAVSLWPPHGDS